ncbi:MAG TPA: DNA methyltransferase, partial [Kiloniellales bacterium]|nr:DNA methyltransferase [Kiloniellales bacterium]
MDEVLVNRNRLEALIAEASASGGSERANYQLFVVRLCEALGLEAPDMAREQNSLNDYVFERRVEFKHPDGSRTHGWIDCYKRGSFILEAKQSAKRQVKRPDPGQMALLPEDAGQLMAGHAKRGSRGWDQVMLAARKQAEDYARALPVEHGYPPFLLVVDVGHVIEVFADFSGQGKNYAHFPDRQSYRIGMEDLRDEAVQARLRAIWQDPLSLDPTRIAAQVTRDIAERLARIARRLEARHDPKDVAEFLMRCLFTMFAEDVGLLPEEGFFGLLERMRDTPEHFVPALESLWQVMDEGGYAPHLNATLRRFNGSLLRNRRALPLEREEIDELWAAARKDWSNVEPAIFGTLLERALETRERAKLGAHYTPRAYVERLVIPTIIEPLRDHWELVQSDVKEKRERGEHAAALKAVKDFHHKLCTTRVLDPACGTGNFLYVALELMKRLEGEVLEALDDLGEEQARFAMEGETVSPRQFYGLELNPRAVPIADLVLWIGFLKWQLKTGGPQSISEPILHAYGTIRQQDAIIAYDRRELARDEKGRPLSRWDGVTMKPHPVTGAEVPDPEARIELYRYHDPRPAPWPEVEFIVGNPPFIGGKDMRAELGDGYAEACWQARTHLPGGADFVMHFWDEAAERLRRNSTKEWKNPLRRFGFITTNSITQTFSRRVLERHLGAKDPLSLVFAVPDHPWLKASDKAAVRIAMTVAEKGEQPGVLAEVISEAGLNSDTPQVALDLREGMIRANFTIGADLSLTKPLLSNEALSNRGVSLHGAGFIVTPEEAHDLGLGRVEGLEQHILHYRNGRDIAQRPRGVMVIDLYPLEIEEVRQRFPAVYQQVLEKVKPERDHNREAFRRDFWWWFGRRHTDLRSFLEGLPRYIATVETTKHRFFQFLDASIRPDNMLV